MDDGRMQTISVKITPQEYVKDMREPLAHVKHEDGYFGFEQVLLDEINTKKMDEDSRKNNARINVFDKGNDDDDKVKRNTGSIEYESVEIWSEEWQLQHLWLSTKEEQK